MGGIRQADRFLGRSIPSWEERLLSICEPNRHGTHRRSRPCGSTRRIKDPVRGFSTLRRAGFFHHQQHRPSSEDWTSRMNIGEKTDEQMDRGALAALYEETFRNFEEGTIIEGRVAAISKDKIVVDIGYKSEGIIP